MTSAQARNAMNIIRNGKEDEHPEMYIHYGYKAYVRVFVQTEDHCTLEYRDGDRSLLFSASYSLRNPAYAVLHKTKCIPLDFSTQKPYLRCIPYIIRRKHPSHYTFSSVSLFHGNKTQQLCVSIQFRKKENRIMKITHHSFLHLFSHSMEYTIDFYAEKPVKVEGRMPCARNDSTIVIRQNGNICFVTSRFHNTIFYSYYDSINSLTGLAILQCLLFEGILHFSCVSCKQHREN